MSEQTVTFNFIKGLNLKEDPWQIPFGSFLSLQNSTFQKGGLLQKRNGYGLLTTKNPTSSYLTTLNDNLVSIGTSVNTFSPSLGEFIQKGTLQPCSLDVLPLVRNNVNQIQSDAAISNGLILTTYTETHATTLAQITSYLYVIADAETGQNVVEPTAITPLSTGAITGSSRVFVVGNFFIIVSPVLISATTSLQYVAIPIKNPSSPGAAQNVNSDNYVPVSSNPGWDGVVVNSTLVLAYNSTTGGQGIHVTALAEAQIALNSSTVTIRSFTNALYIGAILTACVDVTSNPNFIYVTFWNSSTTNGYTLAVYIGLSTITIRFNPVQSITGSAIVNLASAAMNGSCKIIQELANVYTYGTPALPSNYINATDISLVGTVGTVYGAGRSIGLASKAFIVNKTIYFLGAFQSAFQPSFFLINGSVSTDTAPNVVAKLAYQNGGGYLTLGLPSVTVSGDVAQTSYLFKDDVEALTTLNNTQQTTTGGIYSQTGINLVSFTLSTDNISSAEIAQNLHISGGYLSQFDGYLPVENNFFLWPDNVFLTYNASSTVTPTGTVTTGSAVITAVSSVAGVFPGMTITGTSIPAGSTVVFVGTTTITISAQATGNHSAETITIQGNIAAVPAGGAAGLGAYYYIATYEWTDNQGLAYRSSPSIPVPVTTTGSGTVGTVAISVPTIRLTYKVENPVKIVIYRWSEATQVYNQVTSITAPVLNQTNVDSVVFVDTLPDASISGNNILYTTGGVVPDVNGPSTDVMTIFDTRIAAIDNEDRNKIWISKQVIENTPIEFSSFFTIYVAPNIGTVSTTGPLKTMSPMDDKLILFKKQAIYYINGVGPNNLGTTSTGCSLGNYSQPTFVTAVVGCTNQKSIVLIPSGLMFQSDKGIWLLSRDLQTSYIGSPVEGFNGSVVTSANVIPETNYVLFTLNTGEMLMYDYYYGQWGVFKGAPATSSTIYGGLHTILTPYGSILQETPGKYLDNTTPVLLSFKTGWNNLASLQGYERFRDMYILAKYLSPHKLLIQVAYDYNESILNQTLIAPRNFSPSIPSGFGVPTPLGSQGNKEQWRIHAKKQLCESFQLTVTEVFDPSMGVVAGAGFTMSGIACRILTKKSNRPIRGSNTAGMS